MLIKKINHQLSPGVKTKKCKSANDIAVAFFVIISFLTGFSSKLHAQAPVISYSGPQNYIALHAINPLVPASSGTGPVGYFGREFQFANQQMTNVAVDVYGTIYATTGNGSVIKRPLTTGPTFIGAGITQPSGIAVDAAGNVFVSDLYDKTVKKIPAGGGSTVIVGNNLKYPAGLALDAAGNIYVADGGFSTIKIIPVGGGENKNAGSNFTSPFGVAVDAAGNIYVADYGGSMVQKIPADGSAIVSLGSGIIAPKSVAVDAIGNLFIAAYGNGQVMEIPAGSNTPITIGSGFISPTGVTIDTKGNLFVADYGNEQVDKLIPSGGYFIDTALPPGLNFNPATGVITGAANAESPVKKYTVTAWNAYGAGTATVNIKVNPPPLPTVSYSSPHTYDVSKAILPLAPAVGKNIGAFGYHNVLSVVESHLTNFLTVDAAGTVYASTTSNLIEKIPKGGTKVDINLAPVITQSNGIAADNHGFLYIADNGNNTVKKTSVNGGAVLTVATGFGYLQGLAVDTSGNIYVADYDNNAVKKIPAGGGTPTIIGSGFNHPVGIAVDANGNVFVADYGNNAVKKIPAGGGVPIALANGFVSPKGVAVDGDGNVFITDNYKLNMIPAGSNTSVVINILLNDPEGVAVDGAGNVFVNDEFDIRQLKPTGGYFVSPQLPLGLNIDPATGIISGTPAIAAPAKNYTITACNYIGGTPAIVSITVNPLSLSYSSPQSYQAGVVITPLSPGSGPAPQSYGLVVGNLLTLNQYMYNVATDASGNVYATAGDSAIRKITRKGIVSIIGKSSGIIRPFGIAVDAIGNIYVSDLADNTIKKLPVRGSHAAVIGTSFSSPRGIAVDGAGNVYIADGGSNSVKVLPAGGGPRVTLGSGFSSPFGVAVDGFGNVFVADYGNNAVKEIPVAGGAPVTLGFGFTFPTGVAVDVTGNLFVSDYGNNAVKEIPAGTTNVLTIGSGFSFPIGIAVDGAGNVVEANYTGKINNIAPVSGYFINALLPQGLNFDTSAGIISGTPTVASPAKNYTVTDWYNGVSGSAIVNINTYLPPPVTINYNSPKTWLVNNYITPLSPTSSNVAPPNYASPVALPSHHILQFVAVDAADNVYATIPGSILQKERFGDIATTDVSTPGVTSSYGIAIDAAGNIYLADNGDKTVKKSLWVVVPRLHWQTASVSLKVWQLIPQEISM